MRYLLRLIDGNTWYGNALAELLVHLNILKPVRVTQRRR